MINDIKKLGDADSIGDLLDFKLSIKTLIILAILWGLGATIVIVLLFGGVNNTIDYAINTIETTKKSILINKDKDKKPIEHKTTEPSSNTTE